MPKTLTDNDLIEFIQKYGNSFNLTYRIYITPINQLFYTDEDVNWNSLSPAHQEEILRNLNIYSTCCVNTTKNLIWLLTDLNPLPNYPLYSINKNHVLKVDFWCTREDYTNDHHLIIATLNNKVYIIQSYIRTFCPRLKVVDSLPSILADIRNLSNPAKANDAFFQITGLDPSEILEDDSGDYPPELRCVLPILQSQITVYLKRYPSWLELDHIYSVALNKLYSDDFIKSIESTLLNFIQPNL